MTKIKYDKDSLFIVKKSLDDTYSHLTSATNSSSFNIPGDFVYRSYLSNLKSTLSGYKNTVSSLSSWIQSSTIKIDETLNSLNTDTKTNLTVTKIESKTHKVTTM